MQRYLAILLWKIGNKIARVGCWVRRAHIDPEKFPRKGHCQQCGLAQFAWHLPADRVDKYGKPLPLDPA